MKVSGRQFDVTIENPRTHNEREQSGSKLLVSEATSDLRCYLRNCNGGFESKYVLENINLSFSAKCIARVAIDTSLLYTET